MKTKKAINLPLSDFTIPILGEFRGLMVYTASIELTNDGRKEKIRHVEKLVDNLVVNGEFTPCSA